MARDRDPDDVESLLADVERTLAGRPPARRSGGPPAPAAAAPPRRRASWARLPATAAVAAAFVGALFLVLPFLRPGSGAAGAFLGALLAGLWLRLRG